MIEVFLTINYTTAPSVERLYTFPYDIKDPEQNVLKAVFNYVPIVEVPLSVTWLGGLESFYQVHSSYHYHVDNPASLPVIIVRKDIND